MDWSIDWSGAGAVLSAALGSGFLTSWLAQRRQRKDKLEERRLLREDKLEERKLLRDNGFRLELQHAYTAFFASCSKFLTLARDKSIILRAAQDSRSPDQGESRPLARVDEHIQLRNEFSVAKVDTELKLAELILLEDDVRFQEWLDRLWGTIAELRSPNTDDPYVEQLQSCQGDLDALLALCATTFSPSGWDKRMNRVQAFLAAHGSRLRQLSRPPGSGG